jgi:hypothetical protein
MNRIIWFPVQAILKFSLSTYFLITICLGTYFSLFLRPFQENLDDLDEQLQSYGDRSVYGKWRVGLLENYPFLKIVFFFQRHAIVESDLELTQFLILSAMQLSLGTLIAGILFSRVARKLHTDHSLSLALLIFSLSISFAMACTLLGDIFQNRLSSLGIVGLDTAPFGLSVLGTLLSGGLDLSFVGSTPRGIALLCILSTMIGMLHKRVFLAMTCLLTCFFMHITYAFIGLCLWYLYIFCSDTLKSWKACLATWLLFLQSIFFLQYFQPPGFRAYLFSLVSLHLLYTVKFFWRSYSPLIGFSFEATMYFIYSISSVLRLLLLPDLPIVGGLRTFLGLQEGYELFLSDFPRRIALISAPICVILVSKRLYGITSMFLRSAIKIAVRLVTLITAGIFLVSCLYFGFPFSNTLKNLDLGYASSLYLTTIQEILTNK